VYREICFFSLNKPIKILYVISSHVGK